ncbi:LOB domain-containing protein 37-like [Alnus glutinosa]|uniref:LOB domain-containing protein 37-like n=1 Tax=Alnus glutinosa TaxID=3517 RepID=UPI002D783F1A|nr:LOB domain-containing protein 37-like [Alnus glutinosa]
MSCNGCRILRKGCSDNCMLRQCLQWIDTPQAQAHATVFVAKFFGRACLMSFISNVADCQRPALFQSLLYEAVGRTVNPVNGVVGLLQTGNWHVCQEAVETVLRGGTLRAIPEFVGGEVSNVAETSDVDHHHRHHGSEAHGEQLYVSPLDLDLCLTASLNARMEEVGGGRKRRRSSTTARETTPSEESETTTLGSNYYSSGGGREAGGDHQRKTLKLFVS